MQLEEVDGGDFEVKIIATRVADNDDNGIQADQDDVNGDEGVLFLLGVTFKGNGGDDVDSDGVVVVPPLP